MSSDKLLSQDAWPEFLCCPLAIKAAAEQPTPPIEFRGDRVGGKVGNRRRLLLLSTIDSIK